MVEDFEAILKVIGFGASMIGAALKKGKDDGYFQACCIAALIDAWKENDVLNDSVDMAVSYDGRVLRNENAADHCE